MAVSVKKKIEELREKIRDYDYRYYVLAEPKISDQEYDALIKDLEKLEAENPELDYPGFTDSESWNRSYKGF